MNALRRHRGRGQAGRDPCAAYLDRVLSLGEDQGVFLIFKTGQPVAASWAAITVDLDHFQRVNDSQGHDRGDQVLIVPSSLILIPNQALPWPAPRRA